LVGIGFDIASWELLGGFRPFFRRRFELGFFFFFWEPCKEFGREVLVLGFCLVDSLVRVR